jgi:hypothetical protein
MEGGTVTDGIALDRARARKVPKKNRPDAQQQGSR